MWNERVEQQLESVWARRWGKGWRRSWALYRGLIKTGQNFLRIQRIFRAMIQGWLHLILCINCNRIGKSTKSAPPPCPSLGEEWLSFIYNLKNLYSLLGKHLMQLPECMWRSWLMSGSLVWWIPPFLTGCLICSFADCFSNSDCWRRGGGLHVYCVVFKLPCHFDFWLFRSSKIHRRLAFDSPVSCDLKLR